MSNNHFYHNLIIAGFGGQGVLVIGNLLAYAAMMEGRNVTFLPTYGVEMRGGTASCTVVLSSKEIGSPIVEKPHAAIVMNLPSLVKYQSRVYEEGLLLFNSSLIDPKEATRSDVEVLPIPANDIAIGNGNPKLANMVVLGAFLEKTGWVQVPSVIESLNRVLDERYHHLIPANIQAIQRGVDYMQSI
jgi:2-oxoglutarate ferredoxin oxidoreductase subunit gamma